MREGFIQFGILQAQLTNKYIHVIVDDYYMEKYCYSYVKM